MYIILSHFRPQIGYYEISLFKKWGSMSNPSMYLNLTLSSSDWCQKIAQLIYNLPCSSVELNFKFRYLKVFFGRCGNFYMVIFLSKKKWKNSPSRPNGGQPTNISKISMVKKYLWWCSFLMVLSNKYSHKGR